MEKIKITLKDIEDRGLLKQIWKRPCKNCPSAHFEPDPEALDIERWFKNGEISLKMAVFPCAWRPAKLCKGVCDRMGVSEKDLVNEDNA